MAFNTQANKRLKIEEEKELPKNATLHIAKCPKGLTREMLKEKVEGLGVTVAFVDYNKGDEQAWVRLHEEGSATKVSSPNHVSVIFKVQCDFVLFFIFLFGHFIANEIITRKFTKIH